MKLKCRDCEKYMPTAEKSQGVCSLPESFFLTKAEDDCHFFLDPVQRCGNCAWFEYDYECHGLPEDKPACSAFMDETEYEIMKKFRLLLRKGRYSREKIMELCNSFEDSEEYKFTAFLKKEE